jgi:hypothetical protein
MAPPKLRIGTTSYDPRGYVPGGAPISVAKAITKKAAPRPIFYDPAGYVPGGSTPQVAAAIQNQATSYGLPGVSSFYSSPAPNPNVNPNVSTFAGGAEPEVQAMAAPEGVTESMIAGDWEVQEPTLALASQISGMESQLGTDLNEAFVNLGITSPEISSSEFGGLITPQAIQRAIDNKYSTGSKISQQEKSSRANAEAILAARGLLSSGFTTNQLARIAGEGERSRHQAVLDFLGLGKTGRGAINEARRLGGREIAQARNRAAARLAAGLPKPGGGGGGRPPGAPLIDTATYPQEYVTPPQITQQEAQAVFDQIAAAGGNPNPVLPEPTPWGDWSPPPSYTPVYEQTPTGVEQLPYGWNPLPGQNYYT